MQQTVKSLIKTAKVEQYHLFASNGKPIRKATKVVLENGKTIKFLDLLTKKETLKSVEHQLSIISFNGVVA